jgi:large subunit ribosomal protein L6
MEYFIEIPSNINVYCENKKIYFKGDYGLEFLDYLPFKIQIFSNKLKISNINIKNLNFCQTFITLIQQLIRGVISGYKNKLKLVGVGFRCKIVDNKLELKLGFSHLVYKNIPNNIKLKCLKNKIIIKGTSKQKVNEFANFLQNLKFPDPYKGKGIFIKRQNFFKKQGKKI